LNHSIAFSVLAAGSRASQILYDGVIIGRSADLPGSSTSFVQAKSEGLINAQAGKIVKIQARQDSGGNLAYATDSTQTYLIIEEIKSPATISATEIVAASYTGTSGTITAGGTRFIVDAPTKVYDTHNAVTTGASWKFTAPISGIYTVKYISQHASATYTTGAGLSAELYKNGSFYSSLTNSHSQQAATAVGPVLSGSMDVSLNAGDYIDVREAIGGSVAATINSSIIAISRVK